MRAALRECPKKQESLSALKKKGRSGVPAKAKNKQYSVPTLRVITDLKGPNFTTAWRFQNEILSGLSMLRNTRL